MQGVHSLEKRQVWSLFLYPGIILVGNFGIPSFRGTWLCHEIPNLRTPWQALADSETLPQERVTWQVQNCPTRTRGKNEFLSFCCPTRMWTTCFIRLVCVDWTNVPDYFVQLWKHRDRKDENIAKAFDSPFFHAVACSLFVHWLLMASADQRQCFLHGGRWRQRGLCGELKPLELCIELSWGMRDLTETQTHGHRSNQQTGRWTSQQFDAFVHIIWGCSPRVQGFDPQPSG